MELDKWHHEGFEAACAEDDKAPIVESVKAHFGRRYPVITIDGARIGMKGGWALVRASNTGAALCLRFEAETPEKLAAIKSEVVSFLTGNLRVELPAPGLCPASFQP